MTPEGSELLIISYSMNKCRKRLTKMRPVDLIEKKRISIVVPHPYGDVELLIRKV